jgi:D-inositol-3-phosphate glycosyltransferase
MMMLLLPFRSYDSFICTSHSAKSAVERQINLMTEKMNSIFGGGVSYRGRFDVIPLGVDTNIFRPYNKKEMRQKYGIMQNDFVILCLGRFSCFDKADFIQLLRVVRKLTINNKDKDITLLMVGSDNNLYPYIEEIKKNVKVLGIDKNVKIMSDYEIYKRHEIYSVADVFTSPIDNIQETFGITPIEAMSCGIPQVVSNWDGYKESVVDGVTGFHVPTTWYQYNSGIYDIPRGAGLHLKEDYIYSHYLTAQSVVLDENAYIKAFQILIDNPDLLCKMATNSRALAVKKYEWKHIISCYDLLWDEMLEQAKNNDKRNLVDNQMLDILRMNPYEIFKMYPTQICDHDISLSLTEDGKELFEGKRPLLSNGYLDSLFIKKDLYETVLRLIAQKDKIHFSCLIKEMNNYYIPEAVINCTIMLIKRGYLAVE